jgi:hypothetical protein
MTAGGARGEERVVVFNNTLLPLRKSASKKQWLS